MPFIYITADDQDGYASTAVDTNVFVKPSVVLGSQDIALSLTATFNNVTVQGAVVGETLGIALGDLSAPSEVSTNTLFVAEGGIVAGATAAVLHGSGSYVTNHGDITGSGSGLALAGIGGASTIENFGLISAAQEAIVVPGPGFTQAVTLRNSGEIAGGDYSYVGESGVDTIVNRGVMDGKVDLGAGNDVYRGSRGEIDGAINGGSGADRIICGSEDNKINGGLGSDVLKGGGGDDKFLFRHELGSSNVDKIRDLRSVDDRIQLEDEIFTEIDGSGRLSSGQFAANASGTATDADDRIVYETDTGRLIYDSNGSAAGGATLFANLLGAPTITAADFFVY